MAVRDASALHVSDMQTQKIGVPSNPPLRSSQPPVQKVVRLTGQWTMTGATPQFTAAITPVALSNQDSLDYGMTGARYMYVRPEWVKAWVSPATNFATGGGGTAANPVDVTLFDNNGVGGAGSYKDVLAPGVDWAALGLKFSLIDRASWVTTGSPTLFAGLFIDGTGVLSLATDTMAGTWVADVMVTFR